jgi:pimeloyl-ACP methyl ester carboxylesterase
MIKHLRFDFAGTLYRAFVAATKRLPSELWLFSLSPYFSDDLPKLKKSWKSNIGHRRVEAFGRLNFIQLANEITCPTLLILGLIETQKYPMMQHRTNEAQAEIKNNRYIVVKDSDHDVADSNYIMVIKAAI